MRIFPVAKILLHTLNALCFIFLYKQDMRRFLPNETEYKFAKFLKLGVI